MDYLYRRVEDARFLCHTVERRAFRVHLEHVAKALRAIEWVDSGDNGEGSETESIRMCISQADVLVQAVVDAEGVSATLIAEIDKANRTLGGL